MRRYERGVSLLELMIVVVIVGVLASIAVPSYRNYVLRTQRVEGTALLLKVAAAEEKFYLQNNTYTTEFGPTGLGLVGTGTVSTLPTEHGWYNITVAAPTGTTLTTNFTATAVAPSGSAQYRDTDCRTFTLDQAGAKDAFNTGSTSTRDACWR